MSTHQCLHCDANVSTQEILDGWCENCGKRIPPSMRAALQPTQPEVTPSVVNEAAELNSRHILLAVVVFVVAVSSAFLFMRMV